MVIVIDEEAVKYMREKFKGLKHKVTIHLFTSKDNCPYCSETEEIVRRVAEESPLITISHYDDEESSREAEVMGVDKYPAIILHGKEEYNVRYFGAPMGLEFGALIDDIVDVSTGEPELPRDVWEEAAGIEEKVHIQVFTTPPCPYCPQMVREAHKLAVVNRNIIADMIEALEFRELAMRYRVMAVPKTVINEEIFIEGVVPIEVLVEKIREGLKPR